CTVGPAILDYQTTGAIPDRTENRNPFAAPHGAYPCSGQDEWCVIAVFSDEEWQSFCNVIDNPAWTKRLEFQTLVDRLNNVVELDTLIAEWTVNHTRQEVMEKMQKAGVPVGIVAKGQDLAESDHLKHREFYRESTFIAPEIGKSGMEWPQSGPAIMFSIPIKFSDTPCLFGPMSRIGQDNNYVYGELLGMSEDEISSLTEEEVIV
ncbi:MAG: CoA transferase, partial [Dehalococcoidia bacterium]